jgi:hypothetical protein
MFEMSGKLLNQIALQERIAPLDDLTSLAVAFSMALRASTQALGRLAKLGA